MINAQSHLGNTLKTHRSTHTGDKPFLFDQCRKSFSWDGHLKPQKRIHTGEKTLPCDQCSESFSQDGHMKTYKRTHGTMVAWNIYILTFYFNTMQELLSQSITIYSYR